jgi:iron complex transport system substrate-binding protein
MFIALSVPLYSKSNQQTALAQWALGVTIGILAITFMTLQSPTMVWAQEITVTDQRGKSVHLASPAKRIVAIPKPMASVIIALDGGTSRLVAIHPAARKSIKEGFLNRIFPEALSIRSDITRGGMFTPNLESILELQPDLVVQWTHPEEIITVIEDVSITVAGLINSPPNQDINERNLMIIGELIGKKDRVTELAEKNSHIFNKINAVTSKIPKSDRPRALYFWRSKKNLKPDGNNSYQDSWLTLTGGINAAAKDFKKHSTAVNVEQIIAWNPEIIFLGNFDNGVPEDFLNNPALAGVDAIKNHKVYKVPHGGYRWDPGSHESILQWQWAAMLMHPDKFDFDLRKNMRTMYKFFYNYDLNDEEIDEILHMDLNKDFPGYERFAKH